MPLTASKTSRRRAIGVRVLQRDSSYAPPINAYDEAFVGSGRPRAAYATVLEALGHVDLEALAVRMTTALDARGVWFRSSRGHATLRVDPVPRLVPAREWTLLDRGLRQRIRALDAFCADVYGERRIVRAGRVPKRLVDGAPLYEPAMVGLRPTGPWVAVAGLDVVRTASGELRVLEDNVRTPSGLAYAAAAREVLDAHLPAIAYPRLPLDGALEALGATLGAAAPWRAEPFIVLLSDGPANSAWYEHVKLARELGIALVTLADLEHRRGRLVARIGRRAHVVDVVYRRTDEVRISTPAGERTPLAQALYEPLRQGHVGLVNPFGTGVADDKLAHAYVEEMIRFYLHEEPLLRSVTTYDLAEPQLRAEALDRLGELVIKPREGYGGQGVVIGPRASSAELTQVARRVRATPDRYIAQETVMLSTHPTVHRGRLVPRHIDLRPFAFLVGDEPQVAPGGLTRVALQAGSLVVNSSQGGGAKDTWVLCGDDDR